MYLVKLKDSGRVVARRKTENAALEAARKRARTCPAKFEVVPETTQERDR
jgi:hypothetical protein